MPDINLLKDTGSPEEGRKKQIKPSLRIEMTRPSEEKEKKEKEVKPPSSFSSFFKKVFSREPKKEIEREELVKPSFKKTEEEVKGKDKIEDIFSEVETPSTIPPVEKKPVTISPVKPLPKKEKVEKEEKKIKGESFLVNLLPEELVSREEPKKKLIQLAFYLLLSAGVIVVFYLAMLFYQSWIVTRAEKLKQERIGIETEISSLRRLHEESIAFKKKIDGAKELLKTHVYWTKFFEKLEKYTVSDVYYAGSFSATTGGGITLEARAPDFESVAEQLVVFKNASDFVEEVSITSAQRVEVGVSEGVPPGSILASQVGFKINLILIPDIFYKTESEIKDNSNLNLNTNTNANLNINLNTNTNGNSNINTNASLNLNINRNQNKNINFNLNLNNNLNSNTNTGY